MRMGIGKKRGKSSAADSFGVAQSPKMPRGGTMGSYSELGGAASTKMKKNEKNLSGRGQVLVELQVQSDQ
jgi:hypothetical protein